MVAVVQVRCVSWEPRVCNHIYTCAHFSVWSADVMFEIRPQFSFHTVFLSLELNMCICKFVARFTV
jgi:hypothetical protein